MSKQITIDVTKLSPACVHDLEQAILGVLCTNASRIRTDLRHYGPSSDARTDMEGWATAAETEARSVREQFATAGERSGG